MRKRLLSIALALGLLLAGTAPSASADISKCSGLAGVDLWGGFMYQGFHRRICANNIGVISVPDITTTGFTDNYAVSTKVFNLGINQDLVMYSGKNYSGSTLRFTTDYEVPNLATYNFSQILSSLRTVNT